MAIENPPRLLQAILDGYRLNPWGLHGLGHWARVMENGRRLASVTGAQVDVVDLFAIFHDSKRWTDWIDPGHGKRGAALAVQMRGVYFDLDDDSMKCLVRACSDHTNGSVETNPTILTCWDADRLDLPRADITIQPERLSTQAARDPQMIAWAENRSLSRFIPECITVEWGITLPFQKPV